ncbi:DUF1580 domain-containing protein [Stieleria sp. TO1_6]|uniref:DUF1580 domain-containing protein n=1 Tax=Stieleria tagensis TaxID=2956795 RepID=UPI00209B4E4F|nr:DUF1580 domain-containing protein [Stieleria tagensis]MCO8125075.1 DUF1580 domain-containing protein [Stieleria tagensis]
MPATTHRRPTNDAVTTNVLAEDVLTLKQARNELRHILGRRPDRTTLYRWCLRGIGGVRLEHCRVGQVIVTSRQALTRFIEARSQ